MERADGAGARLDVAIMLEGLISILALILVLAVILYAVKLVAVHFEAPAFIIQIVGLIFALIIVVALLRLAGVKLPMG